jgi:hypothetical protein
MTASKILHWRELFVGWLLAHYDEGTKHSTATDAIRRGVPLEQIQAALRHADAASTRVYAKLARGGAFDILRNPARVSHLYPAGNRPENTSANSGLWRGGRDSNPQLLA